MTKLTNPQPQFLDSNGALMDGGFIYVGMPNADPEASPLTTYWDVAMTVPTGTLRTVGGLIVNGATPANVFLAATDYSMRTRDQNGSQVFYAPSVFDNAASYQPVDADLSAIADQGTTPFGRSLLALANQAALVSATGITPFTGGTVTTAILRQSAGAYAYGSDPAMTGMRIFPPLPVGTANPASQPGDIQGFY